MKTATKTILSSILVIVMCFVLITGATFALFSSESEVNIAVNAGKVKVVAKAQINGAWSAKWNDQSGKYEPSQREIVTSDDGDKYVYSNGGKAYMDNGNVILTNITPGDGVQVKVDVTNESTVDIKYQVAVAPEVDNDFFKALNVNVTTDQFMEDPISSWAFAEAVKSGESADLGTVYVNIELDMEATNNFQSQSCKIIISVVAYQSNANVEGFKFANTQEQFDEALTNAEEGDTIKLGASQFELPAKKGIPAGVTITGEDENTVLVVGDSDEYSDTGLLIANDNVTISNLTIEGKNLYHTYAGYDGVIRIKGDNVVIDNVSITSNTNSSPILISSTKGEDNTITIKDCKFNAAFKAIFIADGATGTVNIDNCEIDGVYTLNVSTNSTIEAINVTNSMLHGWTSYDNVKLVTFTNCDFGKGHGYAFLKPYNDTLFDNCTFDENMAFEAGKADITLTFTNPILAEGRTVADMIDNTGKCNFTYIVDGVSNTWVKP